LPDGDPDRVCLVVLGQGPRPAGFSRSDCPVSTAAGVLASLLRSPVPGGRAGSGRIDAGRILYGVGIGVKWYGFIELVNQPGLAPGAING